MLFLFILFQWNYNFSSNCCDKVFSVNFETIAKNLENFTKLLKPQNEKTKQTRTYGVTKKKTSFSQAILMLECFRLPYYIYLKTHDKREIHENGVVLGDGKVMHDNTLR